jgi:hypothetical protein
MLHELAIAFCLMLVIEGVLPFIAPNRYRDLIKLLYEVDDRTIRFFGLAIMLIGTMLLLIIN